jgi:hypothetical protein
MWGTKKNRRPSMTSNGGAVPYPDRERETDEGKGDPRQLNEGSLACSIELCKRFVRHKNYTVPLIFKRLTETDVSFHPRVLG